MIRKTALSFYPPIPPLKYRQDQFRLRGGVMGGVFQNLIYPFSFAEKKNILPETLGSKRAIESITKIGWL